MCVCYVCVLVCVHMCICMWKTDWHPSSVFPDSSLLNLQFRFQVPRQAQQPLYQPSQHPVLVQLVGTASPQGPVSVSPALGLRMHTAIPRFLQWWYGPKLQSLSLHSQYRTNWSSLSAQDLHFLEKKKMAVGQGLLRAGPHAY